MTKIELVNRLVTALLIKAIVVKYIYPYKNMRSAFKYKKPKVSVEYTLSTIKLIYRHTFKRVEFPYIAPRYKNGYMYFNMYLWYNHTAQDMQSALSNMLPDFRALLVYVNYYSGCGVCYCSVPISTLVPSLLIYPNNLNYYNYFLSYMFEVLCHYDVASISRMSLEYRYLAKLHSDLDALVAKERKFIEDNNRTVHYIIRTETESLE